MDKRITGKTVLITGGAGFIGSNLSEYFLENNMVRCFDDLSTGFIRNIEHLLDHPNFQFIEATIVDFKSCLDACIDVDFVFHQAALGSVPRSIAEPINTNSSNITGFLNMLEASKQCGVKRFMYAASSSTYGDSTEMPKIEENIGRPLSPYAVTKYVNELYANVYSDLYGIETVGLRYFNVFGKRQDPEGAYAAVIPKFVDMLLKNESPVVNGDGEQTRDFTHIDNVIQANELSAIATDPEALNTVYNVACGESISLNALLSQLKDSLEIHNQNVRNVKIIHGPERVGDIRDSLASIEKAKKLLGYQPQTLLTEGLAKAVPYYVDEIKVK
ncbi:MAG: UDP-N-acetylglucosamine 4-epimerase [Parvicellaceae bacterium]|jgi:UDP-N-acetylglucosamine 4-epimerase